MRVTLLEVVRMPSVAELNAIEVTVPSRSVELHEFPHAWKSSCSMGRAGLGGAGRRNCRHGVVFPAAQSQSQTVKIYIHNRCGE
jgi:hypothetical protein